MTKFKEEYYTTAHLKVPAKYSNDDVMTPSVWGNFVSIDENFLVLRARDEVHYVPISNLSYISQTLEDKDIWEQEAKESWKEDPIKFIKYYLFDIKWNVIHWFEDLRDKLAGKEEDNYE